MRLTKTFLKEYSNDHTKKIIIYGAGVYGELAYYGLKAWGICPDYFMDRNLAGKKVLNCEVLSPTDINNYSEDNFLIATWNSFNEVLEFIVEQGIENYYDIEELIKACDESCLSEYAKDEKANIQKYQTMIECADLKKLVVAHCEIVVTERCTLRCKDCANLMQYYQHPEHINVDEIIQSFSRFMESVDALLELRILGGEPFMYQEMAKLLNEVVNYEKIKRIAIYTNSTILPKDETVLAMKNDKISVHMSNYGSPSRKLDDLEKLLKQNDINYYVHDYENWRDIGDLSERAYTKQQLDRMYNSCTTAKCHTFYRGKFYICPRAAHGERLGIFTNPKDEFVDFTDKNVEISVLRKQLQAVLKKDVAIIACNYCNGLNKYSKEIPAAIQLNPIGNC